MSILKVRNLGAEKKNKFVGFYIPPQILSFFNLYALANQSTKSTVARNIIKSWYRKENVAEKREVLFDNIAKSIMVGWKVYQDSPSLGDWDTFMQNLSQELEKKGLDEYFIKEILKKVQDEKDEEDNSPE